MNKEQAIKEINKAFEPSFANYIITALTEGATVSDKVSEQEPSEDCVSRKAIVEMLNARGQGSVMTFDHFIELLYKLPSVTPTRKKGKWEQYGNYWEDKFKCSECGKEQPKILCGERIIGHWSDYCPNCGAEMRGAE